MSYSFTFVGHKDDLSEPSVIINQNEKVTFIGDKEGGVRTLNVSMQNGKGMSGSASAINTWKLLMFS